MPVRIYIVEDHAFMREMLSEFINDHPDLEVAGMANTGEKALEHVVSTGADLMLIDVSLPGVSGVDVVCEVLHQVPDMLCLMLSGHGEPTYVRRAIEAGARGYVLKGKPEEIIVAIQKVIAGKTYLSDGLPLFEEPRSSDG